MNRQTVLRDSASGRTIGVADDVYGLRVPGDDTAGRYATFEAIDPPGGGPPPHIHRREEESFYVLEGAITLRRRCE